MRRRWRPLHKNGIIIIDNVLWGGRVAKEMTEDDKDFDKSTAHIQELNRYLATNSDLYATLIPIRDGLFLVTRM